MNDASGDGARPAQPSPPPPLSPCTRVCVMDAEDRYCLGCARSRAEIATWWGLSDADKRAVLAQLASRRAAAAARGSQRKPE